MKIAMVKCDICKLDYEEKGMEFLIPEGLFLCPSCAIQLRTCRGCAHREKCGIQSNKQNIPPYETKVIRQGNRVVEMRVPNSKLKEVYCSECVCNTDGYCGRQTTEVCNNWELHSDYKRKEGEE